MIRYALSCAQGHEFDAWFKSAAAYDDLAARGMVSCAVCGGGDVQKRIMAPAVSVTAAPAPAPVPAPEPTRPDLSAPQNPMQEALARLRAHVEAHSTYVGGRFAQEARAIHEGLAPERMIHGEARPDEAAALIEEGIAIAPLPILPRDKVN